MQGSETEIAVLDYGSQYARLIVRRLRELGYFSRLYRPDRLDQLKDPAAVILSGGPGGVNDPDAPDVDWDALRGFDVPLLGICYGMQLMNVKQGGSVSPGHAREYGPARIDVTRRDHLFDGCPRELTVWMSHSDSVSTLSGEGRVLARNPTGEPAAVQWGETTFGLQFHPEVSHTEHGTRILENFLSLTDQPPDFSMVDYRDRLLESIARTVGDREVLCGVSGGVDSTVLATLLDRSGVDHHLVLVDTGLLRKDEARQVQEQFDRLGMEIDRVDAQERFVSALEGVTDPEEKRAIIGDTFLDEFFSHAGPVEMLAQGTLYPDVIESATSGSEADTIKTHHNRVPRILELHREGRVLEPLRELFKDEVRELGRTLDLPESVLGRHPFPGPGLAIRCPGEVTERKLSILREADRIFLDTLREFDWYERSWQAFCVLLPVRSVGVKGDRRSYDHAVVVRSVDSEDGMTADWSRLPHDLLETVSNRILNRVEGVNRVLFDISTKPPSSIEWE